MEQDFEYGAYAGLSCLSCLSEAGGGLVRWDERKIKYPPMKREMSAGMFRELLMVIMMLRVLVIRRCRDGS